MDCPHCESPTVDFAVPEAYREYVPETATVAAICTRCLTVQPVESSGGVASESESEFEPEPELEPDFTRVSTAFPTGTTAVPFALLLGNCSSLVTNRDAIETLLEDIERSGTDPLLSIDRLLAEPTARVDPAIDLERRRHQLEQLMY